MQSSKMRITLIGVLASLSLVAAACGDDEEDTAATGDAPTTTAAESETESESEEMTESESEDMSESESETESMSESEGGGMTLAEGPVGPACSSIPPSGEGSFSGMADDPAATAASNNPALSTLVQAVTEADLVDTLNGEGPFTIFAPVNDAFAAIPEADMSAVMADKELLGSILTLHVVGGEVLDGASLSTMDSVETVNGESITIAPAGGSLEVNGQAQVICANIEVGNGVVHLIDNVLMPAA